MRRIFIGLHPADVCRQFHHPPPFSSVPSHYANDTVFVGEAVWDNIHAIKAILRGFELASGLKIIFAKSQFGVIGDGVNWAREAANNLNCRQLECPFLYLGIPTGANPSSQLVWEPIITKFKSKLAKWAQKNISMAGKVTLINYVLNALPIYLLSFFKIPQKADGGLGIKDISKFNSALMGRWLWAFASDQQQLWARVITSKYGGWSDLQNARDKRGYSHWWRDIRNLYHQLDCSIFKDDLSWKVGCGENIKFWTDNWLGEQYSLQQKYYQLFLISRQQRDLISQMGHFINNSWCWDLRWRRNLFDHESQMAIQFLEEISSVPIQSQVKDNMVWLAEPNGQYSTSSMVAVNNQFHWKLGSGDQILFWEDSWVGDGITLKDKYPKLYQISSQKLKTVASMGIFGESGWEWKFSWRRYLFHNEQGGRRYQF
ncbi:putative ribonuclease H protein [Glycine soja]